jgi:hypothetical protein
VPGDGRGLLIEDGIKNGDAVAVRFLGVTGAERGILGVMRWMSLDPLFVMVIDVRDSSSRICIDWRTLNETV